MANDIHALRAALFETLRAVKNGDLDVDKARAVNEIGKTLIDSARTEIDYLKALKPDNPAEAKSTFVTPGPQNGITGITQHLLKDD